MPESTTNESTKLWSQICKDADPDMEKEEREFKSYQFTGGRKKKSAGIYEPEA